jgi:hypothetical protein
MTRNGTTDTTYHRQPATTRSLETGPGVTLDSLAFQIIIVTPGPGDGKGRVPTAVAVAAAARPCGASRGQG